MDPKLQRVPRFIRLLLSTFDFTLLHRQRTNCIPVLTVYMHRRNLLLRRRRTNNRILIIITRFLYNAFHIVSMRFTTDGGLFRAALYEGAYGSQATYNHEELVC